MSWILGRVRDEPVMFQAIIVAGVGLVTSFGVGLSAEQVGGITAFTAAVLGWLTRSQVSPTR
jgi:hypothetical protein